LILDFLNTVCLYIKNPKETDEKREKDVEKRKGCYSHSNFKLVLVLEKKKFNFESHVNAVTSKE